MAKNDMEKYEELLNLKNQIDSQIEDIKSNADEHSLKKMKKIP